MQPAEPIRVSRQLIFVQALYGFFAWIFFAFYLRRVHGLKKLKPARRYLCVSNHVSLLDTILLGGLFWRSGNYPILVLGDQKVWSDSWLKKILSRPIGFLVARGRINPRRRRELENYARRIEKFNLVVFPEGTRGNGCDVAECQPGIFSIAQIARAPLVPVFIANMQCVSTKTGKFHWRGGWRKVEVFFGEPIAPENYLDLPREEFLEFVRRKIVELQPTQQIAETILVPATEK
jgi:1-acyl-sn-glycerol-3-phosphate acyltransferase